MDWAAILAGGVFAIALSLLLISFGTGLGLSMTSPYRGEGVSAAWLAIAAGIWFAWVMVTGFGAGGYIAGRMRRRAGDATAPEVEARDGVHGLLVWATGALAGTVMAAMGVGGLLSAGASTVAKTAEVVGEAASSDYFANLMLRDVSAAPAADATAPATPPAAADGTAALTPQASPPAPRAATATASDPFVQQQVVGILARSAAEGEMVERDRAYLAQLVAANSNMDQTEARARVDEVNAEIDEARAKAVAAVERARVGAVVFGFIAAATLLIGAVAAFFAAAAGGRHRDEGLGLDISTVRR
ncbi:MAG: hypothetical protein ACK4GO_03180 [Gemmobacter sp.]